jgi:hypothetical protein
MKLKLIAAAALVALGTHATAAIAPFTSGNGEIFLAVQDDINKVSFTFDTGITMDAFFGIGNVGGTALSFAVGANPFWTTFVQGLTGGASLSTIRWIVIAGDSTGNTAAGAQRLLTTVFNETGTTAAEQEARIESTTNGQFSLGTGSTQAGTFFSAINTTGSHGVPGTAPDPLVNGASVNADPDPGNAYFGSVGGLSATLNGNAQFNSGNALGTASNFYYVTRTGSATGGFVQAASFGTEAGLGEWNFNGQVLTYTAPIPEPETYAMMALGLMAVGFFANRRRRG